MSSQPSRIAFGSCNDQERQNKLWPIIANRKPAGFIWGGDAIYADKELGYDWSSFPPKHKRQCGTPSDFKAMYRQQLSNKDYQRLLNQNITVYGTLDDHDYGCNNADGTFEHKYESAAAFADFLNLPVDSAMRQRVRKGMGVYGVTLFDFDSSKSSSHVDERDACIDPDVACNNVVYPYSEKSVAVFVLDVRTNKTPWKTGLEAFSDDFEGDYLGEEQWKWFETAIRNSRASVNVVVNGLQVMGSRFPNGNIAEDWSKYPRAQQRLFDALLQDGVKSPIIVSGDVHMSQLSRRDCIRRDNVGQRGAARSRSLIEMTTSGMTHSWGTLTNDAIDNPEPPTWSERMDLFFSVTLMNVYHSLLPWHDIMMTSGGSVHSNGVHLHENGGGEGASSGLQFSLEKNFGEMEFDWDARTVAMRVFGEQGDETPMLMSRYSFDRLSGYEGALSGSAVTMDDYVQASNYIGSGVDTDWICVNHRGLETTWQYAVGHFFATILVFSVYPIPLLLPAICLFLYMRRRRRAPVRRRHSPRTVMSYLSRCRNNIPHNVSVDALS